MRYRLVAGLAMITLGAGCSPSNQSRLDAEEAGYRKKYEQVLSSASAAAEKLYSALQQAQTNKNLLQPDKARSNQTLADVPFKQLKSDADNWLPDLQNTLPPAKLKEMHSALVELLEKAKQGSNPELVQAEARRFYVAKRNFENSLRSRPILSKQRSPVNVVFTPHGSPIGVGIVDGEFTVAVNVPTPIGNLSISRSRPRGAMILVIRFGDKERYLSLDRDFTISFPPSCEIKSIKLVGEALIIDINTKVQE